MMMKVQMKDEDREKNTGNIESTGSARKSDENTTNDAEGRRARMMIVIASMTMKTRM